MIVKAFIVVLLLVKAEAFNVTLVNGAGNNGTIQIEHNGMWGLVCDDAFDNVDALVVCKELGYPSGKAIFVNAAGISPFKTGQGPYIIHKIHCLGNESSIEFCPNNGWGVDGNCMLNEHAMVNCDGPVNRTTKKTTTAKSTTARTITPKTSQKTSTVATKIHQCEKRSVTNNGTCLMYADIIFLLDKSGSVDAVLFQKQIDFVKNMSILLKGDIRIGVVTFHHDVTEEFPLNKYSTIEQLLPAINAITYAGQFGGTDTAKALEYVTVQGFKETKGDRPGAKNIAILITDGQSLNKTKTIEKAKEARRRNITVISIGVGDVQHDFCAMVNSSCNYYLLSAISTGFSTQANIVSAAFIRVNTGDQYNYTYLHTLELRGSTNITFRVKAFNDALVTLSGSGVSGDKKAYEIVIGGWNNSRSVIRKEQQNKDINGTDTPCIVDQYCPRPFWISWTGGDIKVGRGKTVGSDVFMEWRDPTPYAVQHIGVSTGWNSPGQWEIDNPYPVCPNETSTVQLKGNFTWAETSPLDIATSTCPFGTRQVSSDKATRRCNLLSSGDADWGVPDFSMCATNPKKREEALRQIEQGLEKPQAFNSSTISSAANTVSEILQDSISNSINDTQIAKKVFRLVSKIINVNESVFKEADTNDTSRKLVDAINLFTEQVQIPANQSSLLIETENIVVQIVNSVTSTSFPRVISNANETSKNASQEVSISLPKLCNNSTSSCEKFRVAFVLYYNSKLFLTNNDSEYGSSENRKVISASVKNRTITDLNPPVKYNLPIAEEGKPHKCVYWEAKNRTWETTGITDGSITNGIMECTSSHLTGFSVVLDPDPYVFIPKEHKFALDIISYIGCIVSMIGLVITFITYALFRRTLWREKNGPKILLNLCVSMFLMNLTYILSSLKSYYDFNSVCIVIGALLHYFVLTTLAWMTVEAINMYSRLIKIFVDYEERFIPKRMLVAWGIPLIIVVVTLCIDQSHYETDDELCRLSNARPYVYYTTFLGPSCLLLVLNFVVFVMVSRKILRRSPNMRTGSSSTKADTEDEEGKVTVKQVTGALSVMIFLGATWVFGAFAIGPAKLPFAYIFCILNSSQGLLIFLIRCALYRDAMQAWKFLLTTGRIATRRDYFLSSRTPDSHSHGAKSTGTIGTLLKSGTESTDEGTMKKAVVVMNKQYDSIQFMDDENDNSKSWAY